MTEVCQCCCSDQVPDVMVWLLAMFLLCACFMLIAVGVSFFRER